MILQLTGEIGSIRANLTNKNDKVGTSVNKIVNVSTVIISVQKSGPNNKAIVIIMFAFLGFPADNDILVNSSLGSNMTKSGPKTTRDRLDL